MAKRKGSLLRQLTFGLGLAIIFLSLASFYYQYQVEKHILTQSIHASLLRQATLLQAWLGSAPSREDLEAIAQQYVQTLAHLEASSQEIVIVDDRCKILASSAGQEPGQDFGSAVLPDVMQPGAPASGRTIRVGSTYIIALPFFSDPAHTKLAGAVLLKHPLTAANDMAYSLMLGAFILLAVTLIIIVAVVHYVLRVKVHKPMQAIFMQEYRIREGDLAKIEAEDPANEFSDLYAMYNEMVSRIAEQKRAILEQKDHVALAQLVRQAIARLTGPMDQILAESRTLIEHQSSMSEPDRATLKQIIGNITRIAKELKGIVVEGNKSESWLKHEADKVRDYGKKSGDDRKSTDDREQGKYVLE